MDFWQLICGSGAAMAATVIGASGILVFRAVDERYHGSIIAFSAGVMAFSVLEMTDTSHALAGHLPALGFLLAGMTLFFILDRILPHAHVAMGGGEMSHVKRKAALLAGTITLHNIPEGFAIASAFADSSSLGWLVALSVAIQDVPEGFIVALPMASLGLSRKSAFLWGAFSGVVEMLAAVVGFLLLRAVHTAMPFALAFSAGAMSYVVLFELLPDALQCGTKRMTAGAFALGAGVAYGLSALLGF